MTCSHLKKLYTLCCDNGIRISSSDLIKIVCTECGEQEVCPSNLMHDDPQTVADGDETELATSAKTHVAANAVAQDIGHSSTEKSE